MAVLVFNQTLVVVLSFVWCRSQHVRQRPQSWRVREGRLSVLSCDKFVRLFNSFTVDGDIQRRLPIKVTSTQCKKACLRQHSSRYCVAANRSHSGICYLAGYRLARENNASHFRRICRKGRGCFKQLEGWVSRYHTGFIAVPPVAQISEFVTADFCRQECEQLIYCAGYDVTAESSICAFIEMRPRLNLYFTLYLRTC